MCFLSRDAIERPSCLPSKAAVEPRWMGWVKLSKAVREARTLVETKQRTGKARRQDVRQSALLTADCIPY